MKNTIGVMIDFQVGQWNHQLTENFVQLNQ